MWVQGYFSSSAFSSKNPEDVGAEQLTSAFLMPNLLIAMAANPPAEVALPAIRTAFAKHTGHIGFSSLATR
jgi:hypothetical protein